MNSKWITALAISILVVNSIKLLASETLQTPRCERRILGDLRSNVEAVRATAIEGALSDIGRFCDENTIADLEVTGFRARQSSGLSSMNYAWPLSMDPDIQRRKRAFLLNSHLSAERPTMPYSEIRQWLSREETGIAVRPEMTAYNNSANRRNACLSTTIVRVSDCQRGLERVTEIMRVDQNGYSLRNVYVDLASESKYHDALVTAAMRLREKISSEDGSGNILTDLKTIFGQKGLTDQESDDLAWKVLGIFGSAGSNINKRADAFGLGGTNLSIHRALSSIGSAIPVLDAMAKKAGRRYALPAGINASCDQGKPYHFWMSAYLSRQLTREGISPDGAAAAVFTALKGYQMLSTTEGRDPARVYRVNEYDPYVNTMRMDFAYGAAGSFYGARAAQGRIYENDIDQVIRSTFRSASESPRANEELARRYVESPSYRSYQIFNSIVMPDMTFRLSRRGMID